MSGRGILVGLVVLTAVNMVALAIADWLWDSVTIDGFWPLFIGGLVLGIANAIVKPILTILTLPLVIVTFGLFYLVINIAMVALAEWIAPDFSIDGFWTYVGVVIVVWLVNLVAGWITNRVAAVE
jgi:putative membrane protein